MNTIKNFAGIADEYAKLDSAKIVLIPVPYKGTGRSQLETAEGPTAFLNASQNLQTYDVETNTEAFKQGIYLAEAITENESPKKVVEAIHAVAKEYIKRNKFVTVIGGDSSISIGTIRAFGELYDGLTVLQIGAHAGLRHEHEDGKYDKACAMYEASQTTNLVQVGIRSMNALEKTVVDEERMFYAHDMVRDEYWIDNVIEACTGKVFIAFNLDGLDPSIMPGISMPEPGGLFWYETLDFLKRVFDEKNVVGFDLMELSPDNHDVTSATLAARLYYKMLSYKFDGEEAEDDYDNTYVSKDKNTIGKLKDNDED